MDIIKAIPTVISEKDLRGYEIRSLITTNDRQKKIGLILLLRPNANIWRFVISRELFMTVAKDFSNLLAWIYRSCPPADGAISNMSSDRGVLLVFRLVDL